jgi:hypothetical protein
MVAVLKRSTIMPLTRNTFWRKNKGSTRSIDRSR